MEIWQALLLGVLEGITEFLPVSSTGHLVLATRLMGMEASEFLKSFEIFIQLGAILAVMIHYRKRLTADRAVWGRVIVGFLPAAGVGLACYRVVKEHLLGNPWVVVAALAAGGAVMIAFERLRKPSSDPSDDPASWKYTDCLWVGLFQCLALVPGVSRAAATIIGGLALGHSRKAVVEYSFFLAVPTMLAAVALDLVKSGPAIAPAAWVPLSAGFLTSFAVALASIRFLLAYVKRYTFVSFGVYRIAAAAVFALLLP